MSNYSDKSIEYFKQGYNCAQAVFLPFAESYGIDKELALKLSSSFGGGMGRLREVCGAVSSMFAVAGMLEGYTEPNDDIVKAKHYELIQSLAEEFKQEFGTILCREILGVDGAQAPIPAKRTQEYYNERPCLNCVKVASEIIEKRLLK